MILKLLRSRYGKVHLCILYSGGGNFQSYLAAASLQFSILQATIKHVNCLAITQSKSLMTRCVQISWIRI